MSIDHSEVIAGRAVRINVDGRRNVELTRHSDGCHRIEVRREGEQRDRRCDRQTKQAERIRKDNRPSGIDDSFDWRKSSWYEDRQDYRAPKDGR